MSPAPSPCQTPSPLLDPPPPARPPSPTRSGTPPPGQHDWWKTRRTRKNWWTRKNWRYYGHRKGLRTAVALSTASCCNKRAETAGLCTCAQNGKKYCDSVSQSDGSPDKFFISKMEPWAWNLKANITVCKSENAIITSKARWQVRNRKELSALINSVTNSFNFAHISTSEQIETMHLDRTSLHAARNLQQRVWRFSLLTGYSVCQIKLMDDDDVPLRTWHLSRLDEKICRSRLNVLIWMLTKESALGQLSQVKSGRSEGVVLFCFVKGPTQNSKSVHKKASCVQRRRDGKQRYYCRMSRGYSLSLMLHQKTDFWHAMHDKMQSTTSCIDPQVIEEIRVFPAAPFNCCSMAPRGNPRRVKRSLWPLCVGSWRWNFLKLDFMGVVYHCSSCTSHQFSWN